MSQPKLDRNEAVYDLKLFAPKKYSLKRLGRVFEMSKITARNILILEHKRRLMEKLEKNRG